LKQKIVFSDFDGTLTVNGLLDPALFEIIGLLKDERTTLIIVSGRSLSWGHFLLTHLPLDIIIMEGGGVVLRKLAPENIDEHLMVDKDTVDKLEFYTKELVSKFPKIVLTADSFGRKTDRAIDKALMDSLGIDVKKDVEWFFKERGISHSYSNVHLNFWMGNISKAAASEHVLKSYYPDHDPMNDCLFFGDAPNDSSMFRFFPNSVGVSNLSEFITQLDFTPRILLKGKENSGAFGVLNYLKEHFSKKS
jgi:HAD superfamily hydrolase (TIGR01484 family)